VLQGPHLRLETQAGPGSSKAPAQARPRLRLDPGSGKEPSVGVMVDVLDREPSVLPGA